MMRGRLACVRASRWSGRSCRPARGSRRCAPSARCGPGDGATGGEGPRYLEYVPGDAEEDLRSALERGVAERGMRLVVGGSGAGKSRSAAEAVRSRFPDHRLLRPQAGKLAAVLEAPLADA